MTLMSMASKAEDLGWAPECFADGQRQEETLSVEFGPMPALSSPITLQLAWSATLGWYNGSDDVFFDILHIHDQCAGSEHAFTSSAIQVHLARNDSVEVAMGKISQLSSQAAASSSDTLLVILHSLARDTSAVNSLEDYTYPKYQLSMECRLDENRATLRAVYKISTWPSATVRFMLFQLRHAIKLIATSPSVPVSSLQNISVEGQKRLMDWDQASPRQPQLKTAWPIIEKRCRDQPHKLAIDSWDGCVTYGDLEQRASAMAEQLLQLGLKPGTFIGLLLEKSMMATVVILGVIKSGCAFVLLDASQPTRRLQSMCHTTQVATIVASPKYMKAGFDIGITMHSTDDFPLLPSGEISHSHEQPNSALYAGFTSGSTGEPKGFVIEHAAFTSGLDEYCAAVNLNQDSRVFQFASYSFVVSITGQLAPLSSGACLCVPSQVQLENGLANAIRDLRADWIAITPSAARILDPESVSSLQTIVMVGEEMLPSDLVRWSHINLYSLYGQSENSKGTMIAKKTGTHSVAGIGAPYHANAWVVHREDHNVLVPIGGEGELVIESPCLTQGYINNKDQTQASFVYNPVWIKGTGRQSDLCVFKTGDLVRRNASDGSFQLVGRKGNRTKIRGQRVELGEVEHQVRLLLPGAKSVTVEIICTAEDIPEQSPMLTAFILTKTDCSSSNNVSPLLASPTRQFREQALLLNTGLKDVLPSFMVPTAYVELARLPKTNTGKVDRRTMRDAAAALTRRALLEYTILRATYEEPGSEEETILRDICEQVLQLPRGEVGMNDTFIDLGGDSLMARHLITSARSSGLSVTLQEIFQPATLAQIAQNSQAEKDPKTFSETSFNSFGALRANFVNNLPEYLREDDIEDVLPTLELQAAYALNRVVDCIPLHISGSLDLTKLHHACQALVARHATLRTVFHTCRGSLVQVILRRLDVPFMVQTCDSLNDAVHLVEEFGTSELKKQYEIDKPIVGFILATVPTEKRHILVMRLCHGQYDALCLRPLIRDIWFAYQNMPLLLEAEFKTHIEHCFRQQNLQAYNIWRDVLAGSRPSPLFPSVSASPDHAPTLSLTERRLPPIKPLAGSTQATMVKVAWFEALWHETGQDDLVFGQFLHAWSGNHGVIGPCINVIPVRVQYSRSWTRRQVLHAVQSQHAKTAPFDALGWSDIIANCTDWPTMTGADSVVLHQNFDREIEVCIDGIICRKEMPMFSHWAVFPMLLVTHPGEDKLDALLLMSSRYRGMRDPDRMLGSFARALQLLEQCPDETLDSKGL